MRLFVGIALAGAVVRELESVAARLRSSVVSGDGGLRWTEPDSWHITLQFLGNTTPEQYSCLMEQLGKVRSAPAPVQLGSLGCFERAGVFFADVAVTPGLAALGRSVVAATGKCGFAAETRPFHPHITLARKTGNKPPQRAEIARWGPRQGTRDQRNKKTGPHALAGNMGRRETLSDLLIQAARGLRFSRFTAREFLLYESHLGAERARYEVRGRFPLIGPGSDA
jgi:2'-5' RNA ligase